MTSRKDSTLRLQGSGRPLTASSRCSGEAFLPPFTCWYSVGSGLQDREVNGGIQSRVFKISELIDLDCLLYVNCMLSTDSLTNPEDIFYRKIVEGTTPRHCVGQQLSGSCPDSWDYILQSKQR
ncbi:hypothetical protein RF11_09947 [Thelohanellus kitauei]|uniref:Uncharacterized protein n=1 Tax=Thelohanellus kitauei TaxID=669202 RepID=A0A0C2J8I2_THEKT|nr:hypothetical protein RF11_09947 [Thelohanellus kitauei]